MDELSLQRSWTDYESWRSEQRQLERRAQLRRADLLSNPLQPEQRVIRKSSLKPELQQEQNSRLDYQDSPEETPLPLHLPNLPADDDLSSDLDEHSGSESEREAQLLSHRSVSIHPGPVHTAIRPLQSGAQVERDSSTHSFSFPDTPSPPPPREVPAQSTMRPQEVLLMRELQRLTRSNVRHGLMSSRLEALLRRAIGSCEPGQDVSLEFAAQARVVVCDLLIQRLLETLGLVARRNKAWEGSERRLLGLVPVYVLEQSPRWWWHVLRAVWSDSSTEGQPPAAAGVGSGGGDGRYFFAGSAGAEPPPSRTARRQQARRAWIGAPWRSVASVADDEIELHILALERTERTLARFTGLVFQMMAALARAKNSQQLRQCLGACSQLTKGFLRGVSRGWLAVPEMEPDLLSESNVMECWGLIEELQLISRLDSTVMDMTAPHARAPHFSRYWLSYTLFATGLTLGLHSLYKHSSYNASDDLSRWMSQAKSSVSLFIREHLTDPARAIIHELAPGPRVERASADDILKTRRYLRVMLHEYAQEKFKDAPPAVMAAAKQQAEAGDISMLMESYAAHVKAPVLSLISGDLLSGLLIQLQFLKADIEEEIVDMDRLLRANELNLQIMATIPIFVIASVTADVITRMYRRLLRLGDDPWNRAREHIRNVERILTRADVDKPSGSTSEAALLYPPRDSRQQVHQQQKQSLSPVTSHLRFYVPPTPAVARTRREAFSRRNSGIEADQPGTWLGGPLRSSPTTRAYLRGPSSMSTMHTEDVGYLL